MLFNKNKNVSKSVLAHIHAYFSKKLSIVRVSQARIYLGNIIVNWGIKLLPHEDIHTARREAGRLTFSLTKYMIE